MASEVWPVRLSGASGEARIFVVVRELEADTAAENSTAHSDERSRPSAWRGSEMRGALVRRIGFPTRAVRLAERHEAGQGWECKIGQHSSLGEGVFGVVLVEMSVRFRADGTVRRPRTGATSAAAILRARED